MSLGPRDMTALLDHVHIWLNLCMIELYLASADGTADCVYRQWFLEVFLGPFSNVNDRIMPMSDVVSSEGPKTTGIQQRSYPLCVEISQVSLNLLMMLCSVDGEICKAFVIWLWGALFLKYSTIFSQIREPLPIFTSERCCLSKTSLLCYRPDVN